MWLTTKLWNADHGAAKTRAALGRSLRNLNTDYIDLVLVHSPANAGATPAEARRLRRESWRALERAHALGVVRAIGVSNYEVKHLEELAKYARVLPAVNQVELHPYLQRRALRAYCAARGIVVQAYGSIAAGVAAPLLDDPVVRAVARRAGRDPGQVLLRWALQHGVAVLPKSVTPGRIKSNARLFDFVLEEGDMAALDGLEKGERTYWDNSGVA